MAWDAQSAHNPLIKSFNGKYDLYYAVVKDFNGKLTGNDPGLALLNSADGLDWKPAEFPLFMKKELVLKDGTILKVDRLERPRILLDKNDNPIVLCAACSIDPCNEK